MSYNIENKSIQEYNMSRTENEIAQSLLEREQNRQKTQVEREAFNSIMVNEFNHQVADLIKMQTEVEAKIAMENQKLQGLEKDENEKAKQALEILLKQHEELLATEKEWIKMKNIVETKKSFRQKEKIMEIEINKDTTIEIKEEMLPYLELFQDSLFDEAFMLLEKNVAKKEDIIEKNKHIRDFFAFIVEPAYINYLIVSNRLLPVSQSFIGHLMEKEFLKGMGSKLGNFINEEIMSIMSSTLLLNKDFDKAKFAFAWSLQDMMEYKNTVAKVLETQNVPALRFMCENMKNIHFNEGSVLRMCSEMPSDAIRMLIEEFKFDLNEQSSSSGNNLIMGIINDNNLKNFKFLIDNYGDKINWNISKSDRNRNVSIFDMIERSNMTVEYFSMMLDDLTLKPAYIERIARSLFNSNKTLEKAVQNEVFDKLFSHPSFDPQLFNLGQQYFVYGLLASLGVAATSSRNDDREARQFLKILESYLRNTPEDHIPDATEYHVVGAALYVANSEESKVTMDAVALITRRFPQYINRPNPNGVLPINQTVKDSNLYRLMVNQGAIALDPEPTFWKSMANSLTGKKNRYEEQKAALARAQEAFARKPQEAEPSTPIAVLRIKMREDFRDMSELLKNSLCDPTIKFKCENMFLKADRLVQKMEQHKITGAYEEVNFLSENFSKYLKKSLSIYISLCQATTDFAAEDQVDKKLEKAKATCAEQVDLLDEQVKQMSQSIFDGLEQNVATAQRVQSRFIREKFAQSAEGLSFETMTQAIDNKQDVAVNVDIQRNPIASTTKEDANVVTIVPILENNTQTDEKEMEAGSTPTPSRRIKI